VRRKISLSLYQESDAGDVADCVCSVASSTNKNRPVNLIQSAIKFYIRIM
jgi:hypothetical protein